jgi:hypothetical protein
VLLLKLIVRALRPLVGDGPREQKAGCRGRVENFARPDGHRDVMRGFLPWPSYYSFEPGHFCQTTVSSSRRPYRKKRDKLKQIE